MDEHGPDVPESEPGPRPATADATEFVSITINVPRQYADALRDGRAGPESLALNVGAPENFKLLDLPAPRKYLPTLAELIDRLSIVQLKQIFISEHAEAYASERADIMHDIDMMMGQMQPFDATMIHAVMMIMLTNRAIWETEARARAGHSDQDHLLKFSHSLNGVRNTAKNMLAVACGERRDHKVDALAADLPAEYGAWNIFK